MFFGRAEKGGWAELDGRAEKDENWQPRIEVSKIQAKIYKV